MGSTRSIRVRVAGLLVALALGLGGTLQATAQFDETGIPEGAEDGAQVSYTPDSTDDPQSPFYGFSIFTFEDDDAAEAAMDEIPEGLLASFADTEDPSTQPELLELDEDDVEGIDEYGDQAAAYALDFGEDLEGFSVGFLLVRDGDAVEVWFAFVIDLTSILEPEASAEPVDVLIGIDSLNDIASDWFGGDRPDGGDLVDQLPTLDQLPDGYVESDRYENLEEIEESEDDAAALIQPVA